MNARNLPGPGDAETFSPAAVANLALLDEMDEQPSDNEAQIKVLLAAGWFRMGGFFSTRQGRSVEIYGWEVTK